MYVSSVGAMHILAHNPLFASFIFGRAKVIETIV